MWRKAPGRSCARLRVQQGLTPEKLWKAEGHLFAHPLPGSLDYCHLLKIIIIKNLYFCKETKPFSLVKQWQPTVPTAPGNSSGEQNPPCWGLRAAKSSITARPSETLAGEICAWSSPEDPAVLQADTLWKPWDTLAANQSLEHPNNVWVSLSIQKKNKKKNPKNCRISMKHFDAYESAFPNKTVSFENSQRDAALIRLRALAAAQASLRHGAVVENDLSGR